MFHSATTKFLFATAAIFLSACQEEPPLVDQIRTLKTFTVTEVADGQKRRFSGVVQATDSSALSFEVGGRVKTVNVDIGDQVKKDDILAELDQEPYKLDVQSAEAELASARADYNNKRQQFQRVDELEKKGWASKAMWDAALAARDTSRNQINFATSKLNLAKRDLRLTTLYAPFDGNIASRSIDPHVKVLPGQKLFEIDAEGSLEVDFDIPETTINRIQIGMPVTIEYPTQAGALSDGRISFIGSAAGTANAFPVKANLLDPPEQIRPGMTAEVNIMLFDDTRNSGYLVPIAAVAPGNNKDEFGHVFVFDPETSTVRKTTVVLPKDPSGRQNNMVPIIEGLSAGDVIAVAGVSFLSDGQKVRLMQP